jgi:hypothetical protein
MSVDDRGHRDAVVFFPGATALPGTRRALDRATHRAVRALPTPIAFASVDFLLLPGPHEKT